MDSTDSPSTTSPAIQQYQNRATQLLESCQVFAIANDAALADAAELAKAAAAGRKAVVEFFAPMKKAADEAHRAVCERERQLLAPFERAASLMRAKLGAYQDARAARLLADARADEARQRKAAADRQLDDAVRLEAIGRATGDPAYQHQAEQVLDLPIRVAVKPPAPPKVPGISFAPETSVVLEDATAFLAAVGSGACAVPPEVAERMARAAEAWVRGEAQQRGPAFSIDGWIRQVTTATRVRP